MIGPVCDWRVVQMTESPGVRPFFNLEYTRDPGQLPGRFWIRVSLVARDQAGANEEARGLVSTLAHLDNLPPR